VHEIINIGTMNIMPPSSLGLVASSISPQVTRPLLTQQRFHSKSCVTLTLFELSRISITHRLSECILIIPNSTFICQKVRGRESSCPRSNLRRLSLETGGTSANRSASRPAVSLGAKNKRCVAEERSSAPEILCGSIYYLRA